MCWAKAATPRFIGQSAQPPSRTTCSALSPSPGICPAHNRLDTAAQCPARSTKCCSQLCSCSTHAIKIQQPTLVGQTPSGTRGLIPPALHQVMSESLPMWPGTHNRLSNGHPSVMPACPEHPKDCNLGPPWPRLSAWLDSAHQAAALPACPEPCCSIWSAASAARSTEKPGRASACKHQVSRPYVSGNVCCH